MPYSASSGGAHLVLAGRHALVAGATRGIGAAIAREIVSMGAAITITGRSSVDLERRSAELATLSGSPVQAFTMDVTDPGMVERVVAQARAALGPPEILVNNAGCAESAPFAGTDPALWDRIFAVNATGAFLCARAVLPGMVSGGWGRIVNVSSTAGLRGYAYAVAYSAAKHAVVGLTRALAVELARTGVTVNAVCPGYTETDLLSGAVARIVERTGRTTNDVRSALQKVTPQRRFVRPEEVAAAVGWLCSPSSEALTGIALPVDGGETA